MNAASRFRHLLQALHRQSGQRVAVLVDEYEKPILDALKEPESARANRDYLRELYGVINDCDAHVRFTFLTGVSKFSKVDLFSQLNNLTDYEGFYASVFYSYFTALGYEIAVRDASSHGRLDMAVRTGGHVYLFEFNVTAMAPPGSVLAQLQERPYADKHRAGGGPIHLIGVEFSRETHNVTAFEVADG